MAKAQKPIPEPEEQLSQPMKAKKIKKSYKNYSIYIYKLLKSLGKKRFGISKDAMAILNDFAVDMITKIGCESSSLVRRSKSKTMKSSDVKSAIDLLMPNELGKYANIEALKAVSRYQKSMTKE